MRILVRKEKSKQWDFAEPINPKIEAELQHLLAESPSIIPIDDIREGISPLVFAVREFGLPGSGNTDVIGFTPEGDIAIIECKLSANPEVKRKVIGQILEYAAYLWEMKYDDLDRRVYDICKKPLVSLVAEAVAGEFDEVAFRTGIETVLASGTFILIVVVDEINEELKRVIRYFNECGKSGFSLHALEVRKYKTEGIEFLVPHMHGVSIQPSGSAGRRKRWTEEAFFRVLKENNPAGVVRIVEDVYKWSKENANRVWFGTGVEKGSFTFHYLKEGKTISIFSVYTHDNFILNYGWLLPVLGEEIMKEFHQRIIKIPPFKNTPNDFNRWPSFKISEISKNSEDIEAFEREVLWLKEKLES